MKVVVAAAVVISSVEEEEIACFYMTKYKPQITQDALVFLRTVCCCHSFVQKNQLWKGQNPAVLMAGRKQIS